jgi:hypothetical protein
MSFALPNKVLCKAENGTSTSMVAQNAKNIEIIEIDTKSTNFGTS